MKALLIDPRLSGASGDMFLSTFIELFNDLETIQELVNLLNKLYSANISIKANKVMKKGIQATKLSIIIENDIHVHHATDMLKVFDEVLDKLQVSERVKTRSKNTLNLLLEAESTVHGQPIETLHLHETASLDTVLDIIGVYYLLDKYDMLDLPIFGLPVNVGSGFVTFSHGKVSVPPPAVQEVLKNTGYLFFCDEVKGELLTPTGAILLSTLVSKKITQLPPMQIEKIARGAGTKNLEQRANVLTIYKADIPRSLNKQYISILETHLDDVSGEILGGIVEDLFNEGALDVSYYPLFMKKNRPAWCLRIITDEENSSRLAGFMMEELGTLGVREYRHARYELDRRIIIKQVQLDGGTFECKFKERLIDDKVVGVKPEYDDVKRIAHLTSIPIIQLEKKLTELYYESE